MKKLILLMAIAFISTASAQIYRFDKDADYLYVQTELDPLGSIDKEGVNSVITLGGTGEIGHNGVHMDYSVSLQTIYTNKYNSDNAITRDYMDWAVQVQTRLKPHNELRLFNTKILNLDRMEMFAGFRGGMIHRSHESTSAVGFLGVIGQTVYWFSEWGAVTLSFTIDQAKDLPRDEAKAMRPIPNHRLNGRFGVRISTN